MMDRIFDCGGYTKWFIGEQPLLLEYPLASTYFVGWIRGYFSWFRWICETCDIWDENSYAHGCSRMGFNQ